MYSQVPQIQTTTKRGLNYSSSQSKCNVERLRLADGKRLMHSKHSKKLVAPSVYGILNLCSFLTWRAFSLSCWISVAECECVCVCVCVGFKRQQTTDSSPPLRRRFCFFFQTHSRHHTLKHAFKLNYNLRIAHAPAGKHVGLLFCFVFSLSPLQTTPRKTLSAL